MKYFISARSIPVIYAAALIQNCVGRIPRRRFGGWAVVWRQPGPKFVDPTAEYNRLWEAAKKIGFLNDAYPGSPVS